MKCTVGASRAACEMRLLLLWVSRLRSGHGHALGPLIRYNLADSQSLHIATVTCCTSSMRITHCSRTYGYCDCQFLVYCLVPPTLPPLHNCAVALDFVYCQAIPGLHNITLRSNLNSYAHKRHHACRQIPESDGRGLGNEVKMPTFKMAKELHEQLAAEVERYVQCVL